VLQCVAVCCNVLQRVAVWEASNLAPFWHIVARPSRRQSHSLLLLLFFFRLFVLLLLLLPPPLFLLLLPRSLLLDFRSGYPAAGESMWDVEKKLVRGTWRSWALQGCGKVRTSVCVCTWVRHAYGCIDESMHTCVLSERLWPLHKLQRNVQCWHLIHPYICKSALHIRKSALHIHRRVLHICRRALHIRQRALYIRKSCMSAKEPGISAKKPYLYHPYGRTLSLSLCRSVSS